MLERVARALFAHDGGSEWEAVSDELREPWRKQARAAITAMREATDEMTPSEALLLLLDQVDFTAGACGLTEMVGAVLPQSVIETCRRALAAERAKKPEPS